MYYLRTKGFADAIKFTLNNDKAAAPIEVKRAVSASTCKVIRAS
jgi:hypothetical protein